MNEQIKKLTLSGVCLALCMLLPFLTGQIPQIGSKLSPMHIPVLLCGLLCGAPCGLLVGLIAPLLRTMIFGMPPVMVSLAMAFELAAYGAAAGLLAKYLPKTTAGLYGSLIGAMLIGRAVWGVAAYVIYQAFGSPFTLETFLAGAFLNAVPAIILHILVIPPLASAMKRAGFSAAETVSAAS